MPDHAAAPEEVIRRERELLLAHRDPEAGPHSILIAVETGLRLCDFADVLLAERQQLREALERIAGLAQCCGCVEDFELAQKIARSECSED